MNMAHDLPADVTRTGGTAVTNPEIGETYYVSGFGICTYEGNGRGHEQDSRYANINGHAFQAMPGYTIKGTKFASGRRIETPPGRDELTAALDEILTRRAQPASDIQGPQQQEVKINNQGLSGLIDILSVGSFRDEREKARVDQAKTLMGCLIAHELGSTASTAERYVDFVCSQRGKNKRDWPKDLQVLPANAGQMEVIVGQYRSGKPVDTAFVQGLLNPAAETPDNPSLATRVVQQRMDERRKAVWGRATAPKPSSAPKPQPSEPMVSEETPLLKSLILSSIPKNRAVFQSCIGTIPERDLPIINLMIECHRDTALQALRRQLGSRMARNATGSDVTWTPQQTQNHCSGLLDKLTEQAEKSEQLGVAAPSFVAMYEKLNLKVPAHIAASIPAEAPSPPAPPRPVAHRSGRSPLSGHHDGPNAVRLSDATPAPHRPEAVRPEPVRAAPVAPPPPVVVSPPSPPPTAPKLAAPATTADGREEDDKTVAALKKELASGRAAIKGEQRKDMPQPKSGHCPGKYIQARNVGHLEARGLNYDEPFDNGCQIMEQINETFPKDPPSGLKIVEACKGKMIQGDFMLLTRAILTPEVCMTNVAIALKKRTGDEWDFKKVQGKYKGLIDCIADHPDYDDSDRAYLKKMRLAVGLEKPEQSHKARTTAKVSAPIDREAPPPSPPTSVARAEPVKAKISAPATPVAQPPVQTAPEPMITGDDTLLRMSQNLFEEDTTATKIIEACVGTVTKPEFKSLTLLMAANTGDIRPVAKTLGPDEQKKLAGLIDRVAGHPEYDMMDRAYIGRLYTSIGAQPPHQRGLGEPGGQDAGTELTDPIPTATTKIPPRYRHHVGTGITIKDFSTPPPDTRVNLVLDIKKSPDEPRSPAVENELANYYDPHGPHAANAYVAEFAANHLKPWAMLLLSAVGTRPEGERVTFAQQAAGSGATTESLKDVFRVSAAEVRHQAHKQGMRLLANSPLLDLPEDNPNPNG